MEYTFEKESILKEWVPITLILTTSLIFFIFAVTSDTMSMVIGSSFVAVFFPIFTIMYFRYFKSFSSVALNKNVIKVFQKKEMIEFTIPVDLHRLNIAADDLKIYLKKDGYHFVVRTCFLKNKSEFHKLFDQMLKDYRSSEDSLVDIMEKLKNN